MLCLRKVMMGDALKSHLTSSSARAMSAASFWMSRSWKYDCFVVWSARPVRMEKKLDHVRKVLSLAASGDGEGDGGMEDRSVMVAERDAIGRGRDGQEEQCYTGMLDDNDNDNARSSRFTADDAPRLGDGLAEGSETRPCTHSTLYSSSTSTCTALRPSLTPVMCISLCYSIHDGHRIVALGHIRGNDGISCSPSKRLNRPDEVLQRSRIELELPC